MPLAQLRNSVSAMVPEGNPRVVTITVDGDSEEKAASIAQEIVGELVSLSPAPTGVTQPAFVSAQADELETTIQQAEANLEDLEAQLAGTSDPVQSADLQRTIALRQQSLNEARQTYVDLVSLEPDSDAGGLAVLDDVASVTRAGRAGPTTGALLGGVVGAVLGLLVVWLLDKRDRARRAGPEEPAAPAAPAQAAPTVNLVVRPTASAGNRRLPRASPRRTEPRAQPRRDRPRERVNGTTEQ
jgi:hypothetical protein